MSFVTIVDRTFSPTKIICGCLVAASLFSQLAFANDKIFTAFSWTEVDKNLGNIVPFHWLKREDMGNRGSMLSKAKQAADNMPEGKRALFSWNVHRTIAESPDNVLKDKDGNIQRCKNEKGEFVNYRGIWWDAGADLVAQRLDEWLRDYKAIDGKLDTLVLDFEQANSYWHLYGMAQQYYAVCGITAYLQAIQEDARYAVLRERTGIEDIVSITKWQENDDALKWDAAMHELLVEQINRAVYAPLKKHFPKATLSNYGYYQFRLPLPDINGWNPKPYAPWHHVGTHQSRAFYGWLGQIANQKLDGEKLFAKTPFNALLFEINHLRAMKPAKEIPIYPWIAFKGFSESLFRDNDYYQEMIFHLALHGVDQFLYWNPRGTTIPASVSDDELVDGLLTVINELSDGRQFEILNSKQIPWNANYILSHARTGKDNIWRFTPRLAPNEKVGRFVVKSNPATFYVDGKELVFEKLKIVEPNDSALEIVSNKGVWMISREAEYP